MKILILVMSCGLILSACTSNNGNTQKALTGTTPNTETKTVDNTAAMSNNGQPTADATTTETEIETPPAKLDITFTISSFALEYEDSGVPGSYRSENYSGKGIITVSGDPALSKKTYIVMVDVNKVSGGDPSTSGGIDRVTVSNGIGEFTTYDWNGNPDENKFEKPKYEAKIIGYIPATDYSGDTVTSK